MHTPRLLRYINTAVATIALASAVGYASTQRAAVAQDSLYTCASMIDETNPCPGTPVYSSHRPDPYASVCRLSAVFYDPLDIFQRPQYGCCVYSVDWFYCYHGPPDNLSHGSMGRKLWYRSQSVGVSSCINDQCVDQ